MPAFNHHDLTLLNPAFDSPLVDVLTELEYLRRLQLRGTTPAPVFFQLKDIFHMLESLGSARIEGNHTTLADYVESRLEGGQQPPTDQLREMANIEEAMTYIEEGLQPGDGLTEHLIRELHAMTVRGLEREGDTTPGAYRQAQVAIAQSEHLPPGFLQVPHYMQELVAFINANDPPKYDLIKVALSHHRFGWIHPFNNGNGRVVRLLTYALMIKYGFNVQAGGRVLNPTAVFCNDRDRYYTMLAAADTGTQEGLEVWCTYVLRGILDEMRKIDRLADFGYSAQPDPPPGAGLRQGKGTYHGPGRTGSADRGQGRNCEIRRPRTGDARHEARAAHLPNQEAAGREDATTDQEWVPAIHHRLQQQLSDSRHHSLPGQ